MNGTSKLVNIQNADGSNEQYVILNSFELSDIAKKFAIYHKSEIANGVQKIYISEIDDKEPGLSIFKTIDDDVLWNRIKEMLKVIANLTPGASNENSYLCGYNIIDTNKIVKQSAKEIGVKDVNPLIKQLPVKEVKVEEQVVKEPEPEVNNTYVENPFSAPSVTAAVAPTVAPAAPVVSETPAAPTLTQTENTTISQTPVVEQPVQPELNQTPAPTPAPVEQQPVAPAPLQPEETLNAAVNNTIEAPVPAPALPTAAPVLNEEPIPVQNEIQEPVRTLESVQTTDLPLNNAPASIAVSTAEIKLEDFKIEEIMKDYFDKMKLDIEKSILDVINKNKQNVEEISAYAENTVNEVNKQIENTMKEVNNQVENTLYNPVLDGNVAVGTPVASPMPNVVEPQRTLVK